MYEFALLSHRVQCNIVSFSHSHSYQCVVFFCVQVHPLFILSVGDFILSILWLIGGVVWLSPDANGWAKSNSASHTGMCYVLAVATTVRIKCYIHVHVIVPVAFACPEYNVHVHDFVQA